MESFKSKLIIALKSILAGRGDIPFETENDFRDCLNEDLQNKLPDWILEKERPFACSSLNNRRNIQVDIVARNKNTNEHVLVEIKYAKPDAGDRIAFPYDVIWDCAKIEAMLYPDTKKQENDKKDSNIVYGISIFLSCLWGHFFPARLGQVAWSRNYFTSLRTGLQNNIHFTGHIMTHEQLQGLDNVVFNNNRPHISLGLEWKPEIIVDSFNDDNTGYAVMVLNPNIGKFNYVHDRADIRTIPFLESNTRECWRLHKGNLNPRPGKQRVILPLGRA